LLISTEGLPSCKFSEPMSIHISASPGEIAPIVLLAGDPLRAKYIAEKFLSSPKLVNTTRNAFYFTGTYKNVRLTVGASGMGCASIGIYSYELYNEYDVNCIIRIGTAGSYLEDINVFDIINTDVAYSESTYARFAFGFTEDHFIHQGPAYESINKIAKNSGINIHNGCIHSSDVFYRTTPTLPEIAKNNKCIAVEMEAFALFANAKQLNKMAATILTISDNIPKRESMSAADRERSLDKMAMLALDSTVEISR
jgi:purine-nucleoside phosphorylase